MAFALPGSGSRVDMIMQFVANGQTANYSVEIPFDTNLATTFQNGLDVAALFQAATRCRLADVLFSVKASDAVAPAAESGASIYQIARINAALLPSGTSQDAHGQIAFPDPKAAARVGAEGTKAWYLVDVGDTLVTNITAEFETGGKASLSDGQNIDVVESGKVLPRKGRPKTA